MSAYADSPPDNRLEMSKKQIFMKHLIKIQLTILPIDGSLN
jgi:hypothetical protein